MKRIANQILFSEKSSISKEGFSETGLNNTCFVTSDENIKRSTICEETPNYKHKLLIENLHTMDESEIPNGTNSFQYRIRNERVLNENKNDFRRKGSHPKDSGKYTISVLENNGF